MCEIEWDDYEPCSFFKERTVKAAAIGHTCSCCGRKIEKGESYVRQSSVQDGQFCSEKLCPECKVVSEKFREEHNGVSNPSYLPELIKICIDQETVEGNLENAERWNAELGAMEERRNREL